MRSLAIGENRYRPHSGGCYLRAQRGLAPDQLLADKLSDIAGLRRGIGTSQDAAEARMGTSVANMADHYRDSVQMIAEVRPGSAFLSALRLELDRLDSVAA